MNVKKFILFIVILFSIIFLIFPSCSFASSVFTSINIDDLDYSRIDKNKVNYLKNTIQNLKEEGNKIINSEEVPVNNKEGAKTVATEEVLKTYKEISNVISNKDFAEFIQDNKDVLSNAGISESLLDASIKVFNTFDADTVIDIAENDLNINKLLVSYENGGSVDDIIISIIDNTTVPTTIKITFKLFFANGFFRLLFALLVVTGIYSIFITGFIFKKAEKKLFCTFIPIYRDIIHLKLCNFSPWLLLLVFIPFIGWLALMSIAVIRKI